MFETVTYEVILQRMLDRVPESFDKREGSVIYDALAPAALELQIMYIDLDTFLKEAFADTATREYLAKKAGERNVIPHPAQSAVWKGVFTPDSVDVSQGERFNYGSLNFSVSGKIGEGEYQLTCETPGSEGNYCSGSIIPISYVPGLETAQLTDLLVSGTDEEETEDFRDRYLTVIRKPSTSGNVYDYYNWAMACKGVGAAKIFPLAYGPGTVKVVIADEDKSEATAALVQAVKDYVEEQRPIGATVTVASAVEYPINVMARVKLANGINLGAVQEAFAVAFSDYLKNNAFSVSYVGYARTGNILLDTAGVEDYGGLTINGMDHNVGLSDEQIATAGAVTLEVIL